MKQAYLSLGSNIEPRKAYIDEAQKQLLAHREIVIQHRSSIYETAPVGYVDQNNFLNMVLSIKTSLSPIDLLDVCQQIEANLGRQRTIRFGPRTIDLDILLYHDEFIQTDRLTIPHPRMHERAFVLIPLQEIAPQLVFTKTKQSIEELVERFEPDELQGVMKWQGDV